MGRMGHGYGSECHLLRFMGRHRHLLNCRVLAILRGDSIDWLDFGFNPKAPWPDTEIKGLGFLSNENPVHDAWRQYWPHGRGIHNWDAVAQVRFGTEEEWLLVEAKANIGELKSDCGARAETSLAQIGNAFDQTKTHLGVSKDRDWLRGYYQLCNRIAVLSFLLQHDIPARLLYIYFLGDKGDSGRTCPQDESGWQEALRSQDAHVGLPIDHKLAPRMHKLFLPIGR